MPRGQDSRDHPGRRVGRPKPTPYFELNDSPEQVARDWSQGNQTALGRFAKTGEVSEATFNELNKTITYGGDINPREKLRLTNLQKHLQAQKEANGQ